MYVPTAGYKWCMWHRDCSKDDFCLEVLRKQVYSPCTVDSRDPWPFDFTETPPALRCYDPIHCNKNIVGSLAVQTCKVYNGDPAQVVQFFGKYHTGGPCFGSRTARVTYAKRPERRVPA